MSYGLVDTTEAAWGLQPLTKAGLARWLKGRSDADRAWITAHDFQAAPGALLALPSGEGDAPLFLIGVEAGDDAAARLWAIADLPYKLPPGTYWWCPAMLWIHSPLRAVIPSAAPDS